MKLLATLACGLFLVSCEHLENAATEYNFRGLDEACGRSDLLLAVLDERFDDLSDDQVVEYGLISNENRRNCNDHGGDFLRAITIVDANNKDLDAMIEETD